MKTIITFVLMFMSIILLNAQDWQSTFLSPNSNSFNGVNFLNNKTGFAVGNTGTLMRSIDGGKKWVPQDCNTSNDLNSIFLIDSNTIYAVGDNGTILKTSNSGMDWTVLYSGTKKNLNKVFFINTSLGFVVGNEGTILKTTDGGISWNSVNYKTSNNLTSVILTDTKTIYICGDSCVIIKSIDSGDSWQRLITMTYDKNVPLMNMFFIDKNIGYAVGGALSWGTNWVSRKSIIIKTIDAGLHWNIQSEDTLHGFGLKSISFSDINTGIAVGTGLSFKTINGGISWDLFDSTTSYSDINLKSNNQGCITSNSDLFYTTNGGTDWLSSQKGILGELNSVSFYNNSIGYAVGEKGIILKTTNSGRNWLLQKSNTEFDLNEIFVLNEKDCYIVGDSGIFIKTSSGGDKWTTSRFNLPLNLLSIFYSNNDISFISGTKGYLLNSTNGGIDWGVQLGDYLNSITSIYFTSKDTGFAVSKNSIIKTNDGGLHWGDITPSLESGDNIFSSIYFVNKLTGYAVASNVGTLYIYKTTDEGANWTNVNSINQYFDAVTDVFFINSNVGYVVGDGYILKTLNGGNTWEDTYNLYFAGFKLNSVCFPSLDTGFVVGKGNLILSSISYPTIVSVPKNNKEKIEISVFPNPAKQSINISFSNIEKVKNIEIINTVGQTIYTKQISTISKASEMIDISVLQQGIYFIKVQTDNGNIIEKIIKQ